MSIKITAPEGSTFSGGTTFGPRTIGFENGVARVEEIGDGLRLYLERAGYTVEDEAQESFGDAPEDLIGGDNGGAPAPYPAGDPKESWSHAELDAFAKDNGYDIAGAGNRKEKVDLIAHLAAEKAVS